LQIVDSTRVNLADVDIQKCPWDAYQQLRDEAPEDLNIHRKNAGSHLAFSHAVHHCLGAPLARLELNLSFEILLNRRQNFRLAKGADSYDFVPGLALRQMQYLWIQSEAAA
jgi:cytochrome P450